MSPAPQKKNNTMLWVGIGGGVLLLSCCCLGGAGLGGWLLYQQMQAPERVIVGKWQADALGGMGRLEFRADGSQGDQSLTPYPTGRWKALSTKGDTVTVEITNEANLTQSMKFEIKVVDYNTIRIVPLQGNRAEITFRRVFN
jgi:hypothetical protein